MKTRREDGCTTRNAQTPGGWIHLVYHPGRSTRLVHMSNLQGHPRGRSSLSAALLSHATILRSHHTTRVGRHSHTNKLYESVGVKLKCWYFRQEDKNGISKKEVAESVAHEKRGIVRRVELFELYQISIRAVNTYYDNNDMVIISIFLSYYHDIDIVIISILMSLFSRY